MEEKKIGIKELKNPKAFIDYSQSIYIICENPTKKRKVLIFFDNIIADI